MRGVVLVLPAIVLSACMARDPVVTGNNAARVGNWRVEKQLDRITNAPIASAWLLTRNSSSSRQDFAMPARLQVSCYKDEPVAQFSFEFKVGTTPNSVLGYRIDDKAGREPQARFLQQAMSVVIEDQPDIAQFLDELLDSKSLYIRIRSMNAGRSAAEFRSEGAREAIETALANCKGYQDRLRKRTGA